MKMIHTPPDQWPEVGPEYLRNTRFIDSDSESVQRFATETVAGATTDIEKAVRLFYRVRDGWRYDPFSLRLDPEIYIASNVLTAGSAYCLPKAILLIAAARASGIPAALGLSDVENHLTTEKLKAFMGGRTRFMHHGYALLHLDGRWLKAAPAFNIELCERFHVHPTEFDGRSHAIFQEYDAHNRRHMEYVHDHGFWSDFPYDKVMEDFRAYYPIEQLQRLVAGERFEDGIRVS